MKAVDPARVQAAIDSLDATMGGAIGALPLGAAALKVRIAHSGVTDEELSALSAGFLDDRRASARRVLGEGAFQAENVDFIFLPVPGSIAALYPLAKGYTVALSLGLVEALRLSCVAGQLQSALQGLKASQELQTSIGVQAAGRALQLLDRMIAHLNASAALSHLVARPVPNVVAALNPEMARKANVVLEAALMFVLLHELGHVEYQGDTPRAGAVWEFVVPQALTARQEEELFADRYALNAVPSEFRLPLVHSAAFVLQLYSYIDLLQRSSTPTHPLSVNRLAAMRAQVGTVEHGAVGDAALNNAIQVGHSLQVRSSRNTTPHQRKAALERFVAAGDQVDWRPAQEALQVLAD